MPRRLTGHECSAVAGKKISEKYPHYERELESLPDSSVIGDPEKTLRHVSKSARNLSEALKAQGIQASPETVRRTLKRLGYKMPIYSIYFGESPKSEISGICVN
jgi:hypothetical protein